MLRRNTGKNEKKMCDSLFTRRETHGILDKISTAYIVSRHSDAILCSRGY